MERGLLTLIIVVSSVLATPAQWIKQNVDTKASLRGLAVVNKKVVWASGTGGTVIKTIDGGKAWKVMTVPGAEKLDFRDVEAFDANTAYILSIGNGDSSRIYKTTDGGATWTEQFRNKEEKAFYDAITCWDRNNCLAMSDPVERKFVFVSTTDGQTWGTFSLNTVSNKAMANLGPPTVWAMADEGEAAFAASGTCLITSGKDIAYLVSGGTNARVFLTSRNGLFLLPVQTSMLRGTAGSGIFSIAMFDEQNGVIVGGNYEKPNEAKDNLALTTNGGLMWKLGIGLSGYRSGVAYADKKTIVAVGTNGTDISTDRGETWKKIGSENLNSVAAKGKKSVWAAGPAGGVYKLK